MSWKVPLVLACQESVKQTQLCHPASLGPNMSEEDIEKGFIYQSDPIAGEVEDHPQDSAAE